MFPLALGGENARVRRRCHGGCVCASDDDAAAAARSAQAPTEDDDHGHERTVGRNVTIRGAHVLSLPEKSGVRESGGGQTPTHPRTYRLPLLLFRRRRSAAHRPEDRQRGRRTRRMSSRVTAAGGRAYARFRA